MYKSHHKIFFFDLDGTLVDSRKDMLHCVHELRNDYLLPTFEDNKITPFLHRGMNELYKNCFNDLIENSNNTNETINKLKFDYETKYFEQCYFYTKCYNEVKELLTYLNDKGRIIIITNKPEKIARKLIQALGINALIFDVVGGDSCKETKPSIMPLSFACEKNKLNRQDYNFFVIGDSVADMTMGHNFKAKTIWCSWGYLDQLPQNITPHFIAKNPMQIKNFI